MTICNMTIFSKTAKYEYLQYEYFSKKIVIFDFKNMTKKKPMPRGGGGGGFCVKLYKTAVLGYRNGSGHGRLSKSDDGDVTYKV